MLLLLLLLLPQEQRVVSTLGNRYCSQDTRTMTDRPVPSQSDGAGM